MEVSRLTIAIILVIALYFAYQWEKLRRIQPTANELYARAIQKHKDPFKAAEQYMTYLEGTLPLDDYKFFMKRLCKQYGVRYDYVPKTYGLPKLTREHLVADIGSQIRATANHIRELDTAA